MSLIDDLRNGIAQAHQITLAGGLQAPVTWKRCTSASGSGVKTFAPPLVIPTLVIVKDKPIRTFSGEVVTSRTQLLILDPAIRVGPEDEFTLGDGTIPPILLLDGAILDPGTNAPVLTQVYFG